MNNNVLGTGIKEMRIFQKEMHHQKEVQLWLKEFPNVKLSAAYKKEIKAYWKQYGVNVSGLWHRFFLGCTGLEDVRFLGNDLWYSRVIFKLNRFDLSLAYDDKNSYDIVFRDRINMPKTLVRNMNGRLIDANYQPISFNEAKSVLQNTKKAIVKPAMGTSGGKGIIVLKNTGNEAYDKLLDKVIGKKDIIVQDFIQQHVEYSAYNPTSVNTVRVVSFLWNNEVRNLTTYFRVGNQDKDFVECHTYIIKVHDNGSLGKVTNDHDFQRGREKCQEIENMYRGKVLPGIKEIHDIVKREHQHLSYFGVIGWDFTINEKGEPVLFEINLRWPALDHVQMLGGPAFGELTDEVMRYVFSNKKELKNSIYLGI